MITLSELSAMYEHALVNKGNQARLKQVFKKLADGESITVGFLGGSITMGCSAVPMEKNCYAKLTAAWFEETFGKERIHYVNAGIGATDSYLGVHRADRDLLKSQPDLVVIEFSVNDERELNEESYDSLVRKIYKAKSAPAVVLLCLTQRDGTDDQKVHEKIGLYYNLPVISYRNAVLPYLEDGRLPWSLIANDEDGTHPANMGHFLIASLLVEYFKRANEQREEPEEEIPLRPSLTEDRYKKARLYDNTSILPTEAHEFAPALIKEAQFTNGWKTETGGDIGFYLTGKNIGIIYYGTQDKKSGQFDVLVDGTLVTTLDGDFIGKWGSFAEYRELIRSEEETLHKLEIRKNKDCDKLQFIILGFTVS